MLARRASSALFSRTQPTTAATNNPSTMPKISRADGEKWAKDFLTAFAAGFKENNHGVTLKPFLADKLEWDWSDDTKGSGSPDGPCGQMQATWGAMVDSFNMPTFTTVVDTTHAKIICGGPLIINMNGPGNQVPNNLVYNPIMFTMYLDDNAKAIKWECTWDNEDAGMGEAMGKVMALMPKQ